MMSKEFREHSLGWRCNKMQAKMDHSFKPVKVGMHGLKEGCAKTDCENDQRPKETLREKSERSIFIRITTRLHSNKWSILRWLASHTHINMSRGPKAFLTTPMEGPVFANLISFRFCVLRPMCIFHNVSRKVQGVGALGLLIRNENPSSNVNKTKYIH